MPIPTIYNQSGATPFNPYQKQSQAGPAPNMSTPQGPVYAPPPTQGIINQTPQTQVKSGMIQASAPTTPTISSPTQQTGFNQQVQDIYKGLQNVQQGLTSLQGQQSQQPQQPPQMQNYQQMVQGLLGNIYGPYSQMAQGSIGNLQGLSAQNPAMSGPAFDEYTRAVEAQRKLRSGIAGQLGAIESQPIPLEFQQGRAQAMGRQYASQILAGEEAVSRAREGIGQQISGMATQLGGFQQAGGLALQGQGQVQQGLLGAAELAQPQLAQFSQRVYDPMTGQFTEGGMGYQDAISNIVNQIRSGNMGYSMGVQQLSGYGPQAAQEVLRQLGPGFNTQQSDARAAAQSAATQQTGVVGGQITKAADNAYQTLDTLEQAFSKLGVLQTGGIPATNNIANWIQTQLGQKELSEYKSMLADARSQLASVLSVTGTPTGAENTAREMLPDNMTAGMFKTKIKAARELIRQKVDAFTKVPEFGGQQGGKGRVFDW